MTISSETSKSGPYSGNGSTTVFAYQFRILDEADIKVVKKASSGLETVLTLNSDYIVSGVGAANGGNIALSTAPASGETITIVRDVAFTQEIDLENQGDFYAETHEEAFDRLTMQAQQAFAASERSLKFPVSDSASPVDLPTSSLRAGKALVFDENGNVTVSTDVYEDQAAAAAASASSAAQSASDASSQATLASQSAAAAAQSATDAAQFDPDLYHLKYKQVLDSPTTITPGWYVASGNDLGITGIGNGILEVLSDLDDSGISTSDEGAVQVFTSFGSTPRRWIRTKPATVVSVYGSWVEMPVDKSAYNLDLYRLNYMQTFPGATTIIPGFYLANGAALGISGIGNGVLEVSSNLDDSGISTSDEGAVQVFTAFGSTPRRWVRTKPATVVSVYGSWVEMPVDKSAYAPVASPNFTSSISLGGVRVPDRQLITIATDAVGVLTPPFNGGQCGGFCFVVPGGAGAAPFNFLGAAFRYDSGVSTEITGLSGFVGSQASLVTTDVTGTTGTSGWVTYAVRQGQIKIENRHTSSLNFLVTFI